MKLILSLMLLSIVFMGSSCGDGAVNANRDIVFPDKNVSYLLHVEPYLKVTCAYQGCHSNETRAGDLSLADYNSIISFPGLIQYGLPDFSQLNQIIEGKMPHPGLPYLYKGTQNQIAGMRQWVLEGANP